MTFWRYIYILFFLFYAHDVLALPKYEVRAVWLTTIGGLDWPHFHDMERQRQELVMILDSLARAGINTVLLQTRIRATTIYPSKMEPWDGCLTGRPGLSPGYDALRFAIDECHKRGMELHAWVVCMPVGKWNEAGCRRLRQTRPELLRRIGNEAFLNPEAEGTGDYLARLCDEIIANYDVDGVHLDYIRYPDTWRKIRSKDAGRRYVTNILRKVCERVKSHKPWVKVSCSVVGKHADLPRFSSHGWNARDEVCQDAQQWLRSGLIDQLYPMAYFRDNDFYPFILDWQQQSAGGCVAVGLGIYMLSPMEKNWDLDVIRREMEVTRIEGMGYAFFRSRFLTANVKKIYDFVAGQFNKSIALVPPMKNAPGIAPSSPEGLSVKREAGAVALQWRQASESLSSPVTYNIYGSDVYPVDISDGRNILLTKIVRTEVVLPSSRYARMHFAVCAVDRYGRESLPLSSDNPSLVTNNVQNGLLPCYGDYLEIPFFSSVLDAEMVSIESMEGNIIATREYRGCFVYVGDLPCGMYQVRSLSMLRRNVATHRLGFFQIRR